MSEVLNSPSSETNTHGPSSPPSSCNGSLISKNSEKTLSTTTQPDDQQQTASSTIEPSATSGSSSIVAEHYNSKEGGDLAARTQSRIYYLRNFNNWIKSVLINETVQHRLRRRRDAGERSRRPLAVLDLGCGRGGDILKWKKARVGRVTFVDIAD